MTIKLLGLAGSLRNVIRGDLTDRLVEDLERIDDKEMLLDYLRVLSKLPDKSHLEPMQLLPDSLLKIYETLKKRRLKKGMSNSEVALAAALWAACKAGAQVEFQSLRDYFLPAGTKRNVSQLLEKIDQAGALLLSRPVYFGDRGSLIHMLIQTLRSDRRAQSIVEGKFYGGLAVGAKRNGGQETTLIYQILDMTALGLLGVGNDSDTTAQYGGTCHAGDVGGMFKDLYGIDTSMGTGRRLAALLSMMSKKAKLRDKVKVLFLILQDMNGFAAAQVKEICERYASSMHSTVIDATHMKIVRCLACDVCPDKLEVDEVYRCIIGDGDDFEEINGMLLDQDAIVPVAVSPLDLSRVSTNYQVFLERTRYLRRGDYALSDVLVSPLVFQEVGSAEHLYIRMITSLIRQHTVISRPVVGFIEGGRILNAASVHSEFNRFLDLAGLSPPAVSRASWREAPPLDTSPSDMF